VAARSLVITPARRARARQRRSACRSSARRRAGRWGGKASATVVTATRARTPPRRHDNRTRFARAPEHDAVTHSRPGLPSWMSRVRDPSPAPSPRSDLRRPAGHGRSFLMAVGTAPNRLSGCSRRQKPLSVECVVRYARSLRSHRSAGWSARPAGRRTDRDGGSAVAARPRSRCSARRAASPTSRTCASAANARPRSSPE
jgi:hypothetical protein